MPTGMNKPDSLSSVDNRYDGSLLTDTYYTRYIALEVTAKLVLVLEKRNVCWLAVFLHLMIKYKDKVFLIIILRKLKKNGSPHVKNPRQVPDSGFRIPIVSWIQDPLSLIPGSNSQDWIHRIPESGFHI